MILPAHDIATAHRYHHYSNARDVADTISDGDGVWSYDVQKIGDQYVIAVYDDSEGENVFLGYL
jgi:hypothetical protein